MVSNPLFSIAIVSFNQRNLIEECIDSILMQTYSNIELIVCDDNSCDFDAQSIKDYIDGHKNENITNVIIYKQKRNVGTSANCQKAFDLSNGQFFKLQAADDMLKDEHVLENVLKYFRINSTNVLIGRAQACTHNGVLTSDIYPPYENFIKAKGASPYQLFELMGTQPWGAFVCAPAVFWRSSFLKELDGFDLTYRYTEDWPLWLKICLLDKPILYVDDITTIYRYGGISNDQSHLNQSIGRLHYLECIRMLKEMAMPKLKENHSVFAQLRCWHSIKSIEARIVVETEWKSWSLKQKLKWRLKEFPFLLVERLFYIRRNGLSIPFLSLLKGIVAIVFANIADYMLFPSVNLQTIWAWAFLLMLSLLGIGGVLKSLTLCAQLLLNYRIRRMLHNG